VGYSIPPMINFEQFGEAYNTLDNRRIAQAALSQFHEVLRPSEMSEICETAMTYAITNWLPDGGKKFTTWLYTYVVWGAKNVLRAKIRRREHVSLNSIPEPSVEFDPVALGRFGALEYLDKLPIIQRAIIEQRVFEEKTFSEIGDSLGVTPRAAFKRYRTAIRHLRKAIAHGVLT
jgi:DNA-directed RNA polymerase specialized sigma24 family protein